MPIDANVILNLQNQRQSRQQGDRAMMAQLMGMMQQDEQLDIAKQKANAFDLEESAMQELARQEAGMPPTPTGQAALKAWDKVRTSKVAFDPLTKATYSPYASIMGVQPPAQQPTQTNAAALMGLEPPAENLEPLPESPQVKPDLPSVDPRIANAPAAQMKRQELIDTSTIKTEEKRQEKLKAAPVFDRTIDRLNKINEKLKAIGAIPSEEQAPVDRLGAQLKGSLIGQKTSVSLDPKAQTLREEYTKLVNSILPAYKKAAGLTAGEGNTETEQENIKSGFGSASGFYEANKRLLGEMRSKYGTPQKTESEPDKPKLRVWNSKTRKFEVR